MRPSPRLLATALLSALSVAPCVHAAAFSRSITDLSPRGVDLTSSFGSAIHTLGDKLADLGHTLTKTFGPHAELWEKTASFGDQLRTLSEDMLDGVTKQFADTQTRIEEMKIAVHGIVNATNELRLGIQDMEETLGRSLAESSDDPTGAYMRALRKRSSEEALLARRALILDYVSTEMAQLHVSILENLEREFPPPDHAPSHEERTAMVTNVLQLAEDGFIDLIGKHDAPAEELESIRDTLRKFKTPIERLVVVVGDLAEQHPVILEILLFVIPVLVIPEGWFLTTFINLFGFGSSGPIKGSAAAWAQRYFWGAAVKRGSWFAWLQKAAMRLGGK